MTSNDLPEDILAKFLEETKDAEKKKQKPQKIELPKNFVVYDSKAAAKRRRDQALADLNKIKYSPDQKRTNIGSIMAAKMRNPAPSLAFTADSTKESKEKKASQNNDQEDINDYEEEESN